MRTLIALHYGRKTKKRVIYILSRSSNKFVIRKQLKRFRKNRNCGLAQESVHLAAVTPKADGCVNNIKFASYLTGNRPLTYKHIITQRDSDPLIHELLFMSYTYRRKYGIHERRSLTPPKTKFVTLKV